MDKQLLEKAISFKGKSYVLVSDRVLYFNENYPEGSIITELLSKPEDKMVVIKARVSTGSGPEFTGHSQATWGEGYINKTSALENAETSAVGRALAMMGIGVIESIASIDEINKSELQTLTENARQGKPSDLQTYIKVTENNREASTQINDAKKAFNREQYANDKNI